MDYYQFAYDGPAIGPKGVTVGSTIVTSDKTGSKFIATKLTGTALICDKYNVYTGANTGTFLRVYWGTEKCVHFVTNFLGYS